jgi:hypothetical protein
MINGNACFAYFNKIWGIPSCWSRSDWLFPRSVSAEAK